MKKKFFYIFLCLILIFAIYARLSAYFLFRPLWHDEASLAVNILNNNYFDFLKPLKYEQSAPLFFMIMTKVLSDIFGAKEIVLRFLPFISSIFALPLFYLFSKIFLDKKISIFIANFLFAINYYLIFYSQEFKQYSSDVFVFLLSFLLIRKLDFAKLTLKKSFFFGFCFSFFQLFSLPSLFVIGACCLKELFEFKKEKYTKICLFLLPVFLVFFGLFFMILLPSKSEYLTNYWKDGFLTLNLFKNITLIKTNLLYYFYPNKLVLFNLILIFFGVFIFFKRKIKEDVILFGICFLILLASILNFYPIYQRVSLYILPILIIFLIKPLDLISLNKKIYSFFIIVLLFFSIKSYNLSYFSKIINQKTYTRYDAKVPMEKLAQRYNNKDLIVVNSASETEFIYYSKQYNLNAQNVVFVKTLKNDKESYLKLLNNLPKESNVWFYYVNDYSHSPVLSFIQEWQKNKTVLFEFEKDGSYLCYLKV